MKKIKFCNRIFVLAVLFYGFIDCSVITYNKNGENLRFEPEAKPELPQQQERFARQFGPEAWSSSSAGESRNLVSLTNHGAPIADSIDPLRDQLAHQGSAKEKRCRPRFEPVNSILGSLNDASRNLNIVRRDIPTDIVRRRCEACRNAPRCKNQGLCDLCERICKPREDPAAINTIDALNVPQDQTLGFSESMRNSKHGDPTLVAMANRHLEDNGLSEDDDRFFTVGSFGPGPTQDLLARLLRIDGKSNLDRLIVIAKTTAAKKGHNIENLVVIDTAHVFTLNDGSPSPVEMELHPVEADKDVVELTRRLNHDLDEALEHKKHHSADGQTDGHLSGMEIDEIIKKALLNTGPAKLLDAERVGEANSADADTLHHVEDVGCKKKKKDKDESEEYYGGYYREADASDDQQGITDETVVDNSPKSISSRNGGLGDDLEDDTEDLDILRKKKKKDKGGKKHHLTESDNHLDDVVGAEHHEEVLHVDQDHKDSLIKSGSHTSEADGHNRAALPQEDENKESDENENERHKGKKGKKKGKKNKKGGHDRGYYGGYRDAEDESEEVDDAAPHPSHDDINSRARSNFEGPMNNQPPAYQNQQASNPQYQPQINQPQPQYHEPKQQYHQEQPALPNSYQPEKGYEPPQDNYQSEENYYDDSSEESGYDRQDGAEEYQGYEEPQQEEYQEQAEYNEGYQEPQVPQSQQQYAAPAQQQPQQRPQYQEGHQQGPQKAEQQHNQQEVYQPQQQLPPQPYPQVQNPVYNHPAPPVEQGTYVPKKPQYNEEPKMLPSATEEKKQYPISQRHEEEMPNQEEDDNEENEYEDRGYAEEDDEGYDPQQQEIIVPGLNGYGEMVGKAHNKDSEPAKAHNQLSDQYSKILREDLTQGVQLANKTAEAINKRINKIIQDSKNLSDKERMAQLDEIESAIDNIDESQDAVVHDNLEQFQARFNRLEEDPTVTDQTVGAVLENQHGTLKAVRIPLLDSKHLPKQLAEPIIGMANVPSDSKRPPFVDPKALAHQLEIAKINPERVGSNHKKDSSEEYYPNGSNRLENGKSKAEELDDGKSEDVGCKKKKKDKESEEEYIMVYPQHGYGAYRENEENSDKNIKPTSGCEHAGPHGEDVVGCKKKKKDKDSEEVIYVAPPPYYDGYGSYRENEENSDRNSKPTEDVAPQGDDAVGCKKKKKDKESGEEYINVYPAPPYNSYGGYYRENEDRSDQRPLNAIIVQPSETLTNEDIEDKVVGLEQPGPSGPFTNEPIDENSEDPTVGCKKKKKKDKESHEEYIYYAPKQQYNEYGGYRENQEGADKIKPLQKVKEVIEGLVHPAKAAKAEKADNSVVQKVSQHKEDIMELPKTVLPDLIEGIKQLRNHHNQEVEQQAQHPETAPTTSTTDTPKPQHFVQNPDVHQSQIMNPSQRQFNGPMPQHNQQFMRPPPNMRYSPIEDNLAMLEAFHNQQNQQQFFPRGAERVGAAQPLLNDRDHHAHKDVKFGEMIPAQPDRILGVESREVNEKTQMFFVGDGIKLPIHVKKQQDGTMHLSIDVSKLCKCNNVTCTHAVEGLANLVPTLEKLNHGKVELEVNEDSFNSALHNLNNIEQRDKKKRSPSVIQVVTEDSLDSGELVPVFDDESYDEISPIKKYYQGDLANDLVNLKFNIQKYYENEDRFKEYMSEHQTNKGFFDEFITKRVELLTNVLSWMKSIAIDEVRQQQHMDE